MCTLHCDSFPSTQVQQHQSQTLPAPGARPVGGPGVYRDPDERSVQPVRCLLEGQPSHGGDPRHSGNELGADRHIVAFPWALPAGLQADSWSLWTPYREELRRSRTAGRSDDLLIDNSAPWKHGFHSNGSSRELHADKVVLVVFNCGLASSQRFSARLEKGWGATGRDEFTVHLSTEAGIPKSVQLLTSNIDRIFSEITAWGPTRPPPNSAAEFRGAVMMLLQWFYYIWLC